MLTNTILLQAAGGSAGFLQSWGLIIILFVVFYFFMIRPQQKRQKEIRKFRESLGKGDSVVTAGGIHGKIVEASENATYFLLEVAPGVRIRIDKGSVYPSAAEANQAAEQQGDKN
ncbi:MAG: preprotein translocase subunit YajC [Muribaculaceae bacterium]|nr:preprotein translocase subunit YajC [Muribaculaceae bacterium]